MADRDLQDRDRTLRLRDHSQPCEHVDDFRPDTRPPFDGHRDCAEMDRWCPGGREVTATEIQEMAYSLWQAEQMNDYYRDVL